MQVLPLGSIACASWAFNIARKEAAKRLGDYRSEMKRNVEREERYVIAHREAIVQKDKSAAKVEKMKAALAKAEEELRYDTDAAKRAGEMRTTAKKTLDSTASLECKLELSAAESRKRKEREDVEHRAIKRRRREFKEESESDADELPEEIPAATDAVVKREEEGDEQPPETSMVAGKEVSSLVKKEETD
jgi:hypothetical protein